MATRSGPPMTQIEGLDVGLDQCPPLSWLPSNVQLHTRNVFYDPPSEFVGALLVQGR